MAFQNKKPIQEQLKDIFSYQQYLKTDNEPTLKIFQTPEGQYLHVTRVEQTTEEGKISNAMQGFYNSLTEGDG
jgi:surface antigen